MMLKQSIRRRTPVSPGPVPKPRKRNVTRVSAELCGKRTVDNVGISRLPGQVLRRVIKQSYHLNILVVGASGLGKSSLIRTLLRSETVMKMKEARTEFVSVDCVMTSTNISVRVRLTEAPGYGDGADLRRLLLTCHPSAHTPLVLPARG